MLIPKYEKYQRLIEENFDVINKQGVQIPFLLNKPQSLMIQQATGNDLILKARQEGFSTEISAIFSGDFILKENCLSVVVADVSDNAMGLLEKPKFFIKSYEEKNGVKIPLKYNSKYELFNEALNSRYLIGTAENQDFGRSRTITNLHFSEAAFYKHLLRMMASARQALVEGGKFFIETTANGFNDYKKVWDEAVLGENGLNPMFFPASLLYSPEFLEQKRRELGRYYMQEYPETPEEAFITSGETYFDQDAMRHYLQLVKEPLSV